LEKSWDYCYNTNMKKKKDIHEFIKKRKHLIWWTKNWDGLDDEAIVEAVLNYGDWDDVQELFDILGIKRVAEIFREQTAPERMRCNYHLKTKHYFNLYFNKYVPSGNFNKRARRVITSRGEVLSKL